MTGAERGSAQRRGTVRHPDPMRRAAHTAADLCKTEIYRTYKAGELAAQMARKGKDVILEVLRLGIQVKDRQDSEADAANGRHVIEMPDALWSAVATSAEDHGQTPDEWLVDAAYAYIFQESDANEHVE